MSIETRSSSALFKRAEQLKRWEESETNREPVTVNGRPRKIKFSAGCVFLAACKAGDREEILRLLKKGADINTHDVDGLSALHQACIDDNLELVEFLVENGADVNKGDNEGWTPLHATASCGFLSIAKYLIEKGANVAAVNNDGELPVDVSESNEMEDMLQQELEDLGIDADKARNEEERLMLADAKNWLSSGYFGEKPHPRTGATALHVASAKGYLKVMDILIKAGANINAQDLDGWTPLHAAAHWGQKEAAEILAEAHCDMGIRNCVGQTAFDVAENEMVRVLEDLRKKQATLPKDNNERRKNINEISVNQKPVISERLEPSSDKSSDKEDESEVSSSDKVPPVHKVELQIHSPSKSLPPEPLPTSEPLENQSSVESDDDDDDDEVNSLSTETSDTGKSSDVSDGGEDSDTEKKNRVNKDDSLRLPTTTETSKTVPNIQSNAKLNESEDTSWKRPGSFRSRLQESVRPGLTLKLGDKESPTSAAPSIVRQLNALHNETPAEVNLRRTQSFEADKTYRHFLELRARVQAGNSCPTLHSTPMRSASLKERRLQATEDSRLLGSSAPTSTAASPSTPASPPSSTVASSLSPTNTSPQSTTAQVRSVTPSTPTTPGGSKLSPANIFKNFFKSFVPPVRDEESETQRKAHAKRVRETRRSTQGVTLEEIKSAEQLVKKKQNQILQQASQQLGNSEPTDEVVVKLHKEPPSPEKPASPAEESRSGAASPPVVSATLTRGANNQVSFIEERRPSWRLRVDNGSKFMLEDARKTADSSNTTSNNSHDVVRRTAVAVPVTETGDTTVTLPLRKPRPDEKDEKESESRNAQATQAAIQRRRRPKRRSTGVVHVDMDEIDPDRHSDNSGGTSPSGDGDCRTVNSLQVTPFRHLLSACGMESEPKRRRGPPAIPSPVLIKMSYNLGLGSYRKPSSLSSTRPSSLYSSSPSLASLGGYNSNLSVSSPYLNSSYSTYGGTTSGYGGISIPSLNTLSVPSIPGLSPFSAQLPTRSSSFNRQRSRSRVRSVASGGSVKRALSEGYQSGSEVGSEPSSRLNSEPPESERTSPAPERRSSATNGEIDYKKLYEESLVENERLRAKLRRTEGELDDAKTALEKNVLASRNSLSETEKREKRAMERKLSEMEEELKQLQKLKSENERLRAENRALTRVVSKLTSSHIK